MNVLASHLVSKEKVVTLLPVYGICILHIWSLSVKTTKDTKIFRNPS